MTKFCAIFLSLILVGCLSACRKEVAPVSIVGKWYLKSYTETSYENGVANVIVNYPAIAPDTSVYYQFSAGGKGLEATPFAGIIFNYSVSGSNLMLSGALDRIPVSSIVTKPDNNNLILKGSFISQASGNSFKVVQELHLTQ